MPEKGYMKVLGGRRRVAAGLESAHGFLKTVALLRHGKPLVPRGLYRFRTYDEEDEWTMRMLTRPSAGR